MNFVTWNVAAINNNPFEYWVTHNDAAYLKLMEDVMHFVDKPTPEQDVAVETVFSNDLFEELAKAMSDQGWEGIDETRTAWKQDFSKRGIVSGFIKDKELGAKRLASMPDRLTNSIGLADGTTRCRPTVISNYSGMLSDVPKWWAEWKSFMFDSQLEMTVKTGVKTVRPCQLLTPILRSKYPAVTEEEEKISVPLQALCCAIFDAILVYMLNSVAPSTWHAVKTALCESLCSNKVGLTVQILEKEYLDASAIFLQEVSGGMVEAIDKSEILKGKFHLLLPAALDRKRDQNSVVLASRDVFGEGAQELTAEVSKHMESSGSACSPGDLYLAKVPLIADSNVSVLLGSFHGDTDGLLTIPLLKALCKEKANHEGVELLFGLDANCYVKGVPGKRLSSAEFREAVVAEGLEECWNGVAAESPQQCCTTFNARTFLQPQLNKAVSRDKAEADPSTDRNPKDYILFEPTKYATSGPPERDNMGKKGVFDPNAPFPTLQFPSDHAALYVRLSQL